MIKLPESKYRDTSAYDNQEMREANTLMHTYIRHLGVGWLTSLPYYYA